MSELTEHVDFVRRLAQASSETSLLTTSLLNIVEDLAVAVDRLVAEHPHPPEHERGFGTI